MDLRDSDSDVFSLRHYYLRSVPIRVYMFRNGNKYTEFDGLSYGANF